MAHDRLPRDLDAKELIRKLEVLGYEVIRQTGSHVRIRTFRDGEHSETIPWHSPLKIGTLAAILRNIAEHHRLTRSELLEAIRL